MKKAYLSSVLLANLIVWGNVYAEEYYTIYPRVWLADFSSTTKNGGWNDNQNYDVTGDSTLYGGTLQISSVGSNKDTFITLYTGSVDGEHNYLGGGTYEADRFDVEYLVRSRGKTFDSYIGARMVSFTDEAGTTVNQDGSNLFFFGEIGAGKSIPLGESKTHSLFGNIIFAGGFGFGNEDYKTQNESWSGTEIAAFYDINFGYHFKMSKTISGQLRYRRFASLPVGDDGELSIDGIELSIGYTYQ